jgi:alkylation response protein AidB-like acyl-CoA dehydrogenase
MYAYTAPGYCGFLCGIARRVLDEVIRIAQSKRRGSFGNKAVSLADRAVFQRRVGESDLMLRAVRGLMSSLAQKTFDEAADGSPATVATEFEIRATLSLVATTTLKIVTDAFYYAGGSGVWSGHILERSLRDLQIANTHIWVSDVAIEQHGQSLLAGEH